MQREDKGANPHRARYHSSVLDIENLDAGQAFEELPDTYTIFIVEKDFYGMGKPVYSIERMNLDTGKPFGDGEHILYVNGEYRGDSDIGRLMHDFSCPDAGRMNFELMAERTRYLKENPKGVQEMCRVIEDMRREERAEGFKAGVEAGVRKGVKAGVKEGVRKGAIKSSKMTALRMLADGSVPLEKIAEFSGLPLDKVKRLRSSRGM